MTKPYKLIDLFGGVAQLSEPVVINQARHYLKCLLRSITPKFFVFLSMACEIKLMSRESIVKAIFQRLMCSWHCVSEAATQWHGLSTFEG
jgi:hypothetical protein